jgi:hypothetical protein
MATIIKLHEAFVEPPATIMTSPNAAPNNTPVNGAARQDHRPHVPDVGPCGLSVVRFEIFDFAWNRWAHVLSG